MLEPRIRKGSGRQGALETSPAPARPVVNVALVRQYQYVFGAVCPQTGDFEYMTAPDMKTDNMSLFL
ncbi:MAG: hypothetical protein LBQ79_03300, partial [Deltaproteobacteria bacterium]|nr:hypothetical protein [Deltaproteobacteria bacterium]